MSPGDRVLSQYDRVTSKMVLERFCVGDGGVYSGLQIHCSGLQEDRAESNTFRRQFQVDMICLIGKMVILKRLYVSDTG